MKLAAKIDKQFYDNSLEGLYLNFIQSLEAVAAFYTISCVANAELQLINPSGLRHRLSDDFPDGYTTIISDNEIVDNIKSGYYKDNLKELCVISLCSIFEDYINQLLNILSLSESDALKYKTLARDFRLRVDSKNGTLKKIYYIIKQLGFSQHPFEHDQPIQMLGEMFTIRNIIIHSRGIILRDSDKDKIWPKHKKDSKIVITDNSIDDFLHRIVIHMSGFTKRIDDYLENQSRIK